MQPPLVITPQHSWRRYAQDIYSYAELIVFLAGRDLAVRYKQTIAGVAWAILVPILTAWGLSLVFGHVAGVAGSSFPVVYAGMIFWQLAATTLQTGGTSLITNQNLVTKLYFPRILLPLSSLGVALVDLLINLALLGLISLSLGQLPTWRWCTLPLWIGLGAVAALGPTLLCAAGLIRYRDLRFIIPFVLQFGLFLTPVGYTSAAIPASWQPWWQLNPWVAPIEGLRWAMGGPWPDIWPSIAMAGVLLAWGLWVFARAERTAGEEL